MNCGGCCPDRSFVTDDICGNFITTHTTLTPLTVFDTNGTIFPFGTISIFYDQGVLPTIIATVHHSGGGSTPLIVPEGNTISATLSDIASVSIDTPEAFGKYCLILHFQA